MPISCLPRNAPPRSKYFTVIATFTLAIAAGASPVEAAILANHAAGVVVGKIGTATASIEELLNSFSK